jgi:hypothetical protein
MLISTLTSVRHLLMPSTAAGPRVTSAALTDLFVGVQTLPVPSRSPNVAMQTITILLHPCRNAQSWQAKRQRDHYIVMQASISLSRSEFIA